MAGTKQKPPPFLGLEALSFTPLAPFRFWPPLGGFVVFSAKSNQPTNVPHGTLFTHYAS